MRRALPWQYVIISLIWTYSVDIYVTRCGKSLIIAWFTAHDHLTQVGSRDPFQYNRQDVPPQDPCSPQATRPEVRNHPVAPTNWQTHRQQCCRSARQIGLRATGKFQAQIPRHRDTARSHNETHRRTLQRGPGHQTTELFIQQLVQANNKASKGSFHITGLYMCVCIYIYIYTHTYIYIYMCVLTCIYKHATYSRTHTHVGLNRDTL